MLADISYKNIWKISFPIIISGIAQNVVNVTDTMFLGKLSKVALGAGGNAGIFYFVLVTAGLGFTTGGQIIIGRRNGEKNYQQIGNIVDHCLYFIIPLGLILFAFIKFLSPFLLEKITQSPNILEASLDYLNYRSFGIVFAYANFVFMAFYVGTTKTKILMPITILMMVTNVFLDYALIFGNFGFPQMGIKGAALASVISEVVAFTFCVVYTLKQVDTKKFNLFNFKVFDTGIFKRILSVGSPIMFQNFLSLSSWFIFFMIIEKIGETELATSHIIRSIYMVLMIPLFGFSSTTNTLVSNVIGQNRSSIVIPLIKKIVFMSIISTSIMLIFNLLLPHEMIGLYTDDITLIDGAIPTLNVISGTMFFFAIAQIIFSGVSGTGNTKTALLIEFINISIYLVAAYHIAFTFKQSLPIVWCSEFIYFGLLGIISFSYLKWGNWGKVSI